MPMVKDYLYNKFKHGIESGVMQYGVGQETTSAEVAEILATSNYDWLFVDGEHGGHTVTTILDIARAIAAYDMTPVVRIQVMRPEVIAVSEQRQFAQVVSVVTLIILIATSMKFVSCRKLKAFVVGKILRL